MDEQKNESVRSPEEQEILFEEKQDRRLLSHVPDATGKRSNYSRRGAVDTLRTEDYAQYEQDAKNGQRYLVDYPVTMHLSNGSVMEARAVDISTTGILVQIPTADGQEPSFDKDVKLTFEIVPGSLPEGYEMKVKKLPALVARKFRKGTGEILFGIEFKTTLAEYAAKNRRDYRLWTATFFLAVIAFIIVLMRAESVIYFKFNRWLYLYSIIAAMFLLTRYLFATFYRPVRIDPNYTPGVSIIIPCFEEEEWIQRTVHSCINQDYPVDKLEVIVVDDCSKDRSAERVEEIIAKL